ncbi:MAG: ATP-binding cassette domain-containing protein [Saprospiraceae bacterium]
MTNILEIREVSKHYGQKTVVDRVSMQIPAGCVFGLLGPNGAGKTSLIRMITTITRPDSGEIFLLGERLNSHHPSIIGYLPEERGLYKKMKVGEQLIYLAQLKGVEKKRATDAAKQWLEKLDLGDRWAQPVETLSKGLQQQVQFVATVLHEPQLLILDEPFSGLDPVNTNKLKTEIAALHESGVSIIFSTHRMEQVEEVCEYIALINAGKKVLDGPVEDIRQRYKQHHFCLQYRGQMPEALAQKYEWVSDGKQKVVLAAQPGETANSLLPGILATGVEILSFAEVLPDMNSIFIKVVNESTHTTYHPAN